MWIKILRQSSLFVAVVCLSWVAHSQSRASNKNALPEIGVVASEALTIDREIQIGEIVMRQLRGQAPIIYDPVLEEYIQDLGNRLVLEADNTKFPFTFFVLNNQVINAFAFFGGHIGIHSGLITQADTESELASVVAHEIAHVTQRHIARSTQAQQKSAPLQIASLIGGVLLAMADPNAGMAAISVGMAGNQQNQINYTRMMEQEADNIGIGILAKAGFDPNGAPVFFGKLAANARSQYTSETMFLRTHPIPETRISETRARAQTYRKANVPVSVNFQLAKARIQARYEKNPQANIVSFTEQLEKQSYALKEAAQYGLAMSYFEAEQYAQSQRTLQSLLDADPENLFYLDLMTDVLLKQQGSKQAIALLEDLWILQPQNKVLTLNYANALMQDKQVEKAIEALRDLLLVDNEHFLSYSMLIDAYSQSQQKKEMHKASAERFALILAYPLAINELNYAYKQVQDDYLEKQRIKARIEQFRRAQETLTRM